MGAKRKRTKQAGKAAAQAKRDKKAKLRTSTVTRGKKK